MKEKLSRFTWIAIASISLLVVGLMVASLQNLWGILSVPLLFFLPGFVLTMILFSSNTLGIAERLLLSLGLSVALTALSGLLLFQVGTMWAAILLISAIFIAVIYFLRHRSSGDVIPLPVGVNLNARQLALMAVAALMTIAAVRIARTPTPQQGLEGYTLLWVQAGDSPATIRVGVESEEFETTSYQVNYVINGRVRGGPTIRLKPGETWERVVQVPIDTLKGSSFTVLLYRLDNPAEVYRHVVWWPESQ